MTDDDPPTGAEAIREAKRQGLTLGQLQNSGGDRRDPAVSIKKCARYRRQLADGASLGLLAERAAYRKTTIRKHATGDCSHRDRAPPVAWDDDRQRWVVDS